MIVELTVENLAIIERSQLTLGPGFTALTGETGAGKSLLIDAIELALGERADSELVRSGAPRASVSVVLDLSDNPDLIAKCNELGIELDDTTLYINREVFAEGRSQCRVGGKLTPVGALRQLGQYLVDLHGQHDHQSLLDPERHVVFLDDWIGKPAEELLGLVSEAAYRADDIRRRLNTLRQGQRDREQRLDLLRFQINEIESLNPRPGEMEELEVQLSRLQHVERLAQAAFGALDSLEDREQSADELLSGAVKAIEDSVRYDASLEEIAETLRGALVQLQEGAHALRNYSEEIEADPAKLDEVANRIDALKRLRRKYGDDEATILQFLDKARNDLESFEDAEGNETELAAALEAAEGELAERCAELTSLRKERSIEFAELVQAQLRDLAMDRAVFEVGFQPKPPDASGGDRIEFFFSANAGEAPRPLSKIASGGEISRVMLAIKTAMAGRAGVPTLVFDEVDAGLGGRAAAVVARKLEELAAHYQILVISHLPQIASRATTHYRIDKVAVAGRDVTQVRELRPDERVQEIARMLAGEHVTDSALANAREMLTGKAEPSTLFD
jgi:DNA repair protein RecN (Recombination protein N)